VGVCNQITYLVIYYLTSWLVALLKVIDASIQIPNIFDITVSFKFLNFSFQIFLLFVPETSVIITYYIVQIIYTALAWILYPLHFGLLPLIQENLRILHQIMESIQVRGFVCEYTASN